MTKPVYAVAPEEGAHKPWITNGKRYLVSEDDYDGWFYITDDNGQKTPCRWHNDSDLAPGTNWRRIEGEEADTAVTLDDLLAALEPFATFAETFVDSEGWKHPPMSERLVDWFGPSDFRLARNALERARAGGAA